MSKSGLWTIAGIAVFTLLGLVYLALTWEAPQGTTTVVLPAPSETESPAQSAGSSSASGSSVNSSNNNTQTLPQIRIQPQQPAPAIAEQEAEVAPTPVEVEPEQPDSVAEAENEVELPSLNNSDSFVLDNLRMLENGVALIQRLNPEQLIRSFVVLVENVSRDTFPQTGLPYQSMGEEMAVTNIDENLFVMDDSAHRRFDAVIDTFVAVDSEAAMAIYRLLSPLFQQAYSEIGYRDQDFDLTLNQAIDNVLAMELPEGPYQLVKPSVMYLYADAEIENLSTVHKQLIRIGPENTARLKNKLRQFQNRL